MRLFLSTFALTLGLLVPLCAPAAAITITNGSFEDPAVATTPTGSTVIPGWSAIGVNVGVNPVTDATGATARPFANNGRIPDGQKVAFLQSLSNPAVFTSIYQDLFGFNSSRTYVLVYFENSRANYNSAKTWATLGTDKIVEDHVVNPVAGSGNYSPQYHRRFSKEFKVSAGPADALRLTFAMTSSSGRSELPNEVRDTVGADSALLLDQIAIYEIGDTKLTFARRSFLDHQSVTLKFSGKKLDPTTVANPNNYVFNPPLAVETARLLADGLTVELKTMVSLEDSPEYKVTVRGLLDTDGKAMFSTNSTQTVVVTPNDPAEFNTSIPGYLDDFQGSMRDPGWIPRGPGGDVYRQTYGVLKVSTAAGAPNHLLYEGMPYDKKNQEILARIRLLNVAGSGIGLAASTDDQSRGVNFLLQKDDAVGTGSQFRLDTAGTVKPISLPWNSQQWYWIRLVHTVENGKSLAKGKIWRADRETEEPTLFELFEYGPSTSTLEGFAGLAASSNDQAGAFDVDWILIKAAGLPLVSVTPPQPLEPALTIRHLAQTVELSWSADLNRFILQRNESLSPETWSPYEGTVTETPEGFLVVEPVDQWNQYFYRLLEQ